MSILLFLFACDGDGTGALLEYRPACVAEVGCVLPEAGLDPGGIGNINRAEPEGVRHTGGALLWRAAIVLGKAGGRAAHRRQHRAESKVKSRNHMDHSCWAMKIAEEIVALTKPT